jgi:hydroxypyruvate reductase
MHPRQLLRALFEKAVAAVEPRQAVLSHCRVDGGHLRVGEKSWRLDDFPRVIVVGAGKASAPMAQAIEQLLGERITGGVVVVKYGHVAKLERVRLMESAHPVPDEAGVAGAAAIEQVVTGLGKNDLVIGCWSGGASALIPAPRACLSLADKQAVTKLLLHSGADIRAMNTVRKHLSRVKGGQLARRAAPAAMLNLMMSDVIGDDLSVIGSGPTVPDPSTWADVAAIVEKFKLRERLPESVNKILSQSLPDTPKADEACFAETHNCIVASNRQAIAAAANEARRHGYECVVIDEPQTGEARDTARVFCERLKNGTRQVLIAGGEVTVTISGASGKGGRAQEFALAAALAIRDRPLTVLAGGTDGNDGPTDAAGAIVDGQTVARGAGKNLDAKRHLDSHDANPFFAALGDLIVTGPTNTNVMDVYLGVCSPVASVPDLLP